MKKGMRKFCQTEGLVLTYSAEYLGNNVRVIELKNEEHRKGKQRETEQRLEAMETDHFSKRRT